MFAFSFFNLTMQAVGCAEGIVVKVYKVKPKGYETNRTIAIIIGVCLLLSNATISVLCSMDEF